MTDLRPETEADLAEAVRAARRGLRIVGGGTRWAGGVGGDCLHVSGLRGITLYEPGALTLIARAGTPLAEVEAALAAEGQRLPFEPWDARPMLGTEGAPTVGGMAATNASGPRRIQAGACRDSMIGVRFVDGEGNVAKNGGRVMKNVTGLDLVKLLAGSHGTLGVLTEVAFKVLPRAEAVATLVFEDLDPSRAVEAMTAALGTPLQVSGAAHAPQGLGTKPATLLRLEGFEASVAYRAAALAAALAEFGAARVEHGPGPWVWVRDAAQFAGRPGDVWRVSVKPTDGPRAHAALPQAETLLDWAGGLVWARVAEGTDLRAALVGIPGHATLVRASDATRERLGTFAPEAAAVAALSAGLRAKFDPRGVLNPGRMAAPVSALI